jgi:hypothetical protein
VIGWHRHLGVNLSAIDSGDACFKVKFVRLTFDVKSRGFFLGGYRNLLGLYEIQ